MTSNVLRVKSSPMGPYMDLMESMSREEKLAVVAFLVDTMQNEQPVSSSKKTITARQVPDSFKKLRGMVSITEKDMAEDERLAYIMNR